MSKARREAAKRLSRATMRRFGDGHCLSCGAPLTGITGPNREPDQGDIMVCAYCSHVMEWKDGAFAELDDQTVKDIAGDPDVLVAVELSGEFRKSAPKAVCAACNAANDYGRIRCTACGAPLVFPVAAGPKWRTGPLQ